MDLSEFEEALKEHVQKMLEDQRIPEAFAEDAFTCLLGAILTSVRDVHYPFYAGAVEQRWKENTEEGETGEFDSVTDPDVLF